MRHKSFGNLRLESLGILILRVLIGSSMVMVYGWPAVLDFFSGATEYPDPLGIGARSSLFLMAMAQFVGALLIVFGLFTRFACIPLILGLGVALFVFHAGDPFEHKELAFLYLSAFLSILLLGSGEYSLDAFVKKYRGNGEGV